MGDLDSLYQQVILDHSRNPRFFVEEHVKDEAEGSECYNPLCGDRIKVYARLADGVIDYLEFFGKGCAISVASASLMCEVLQHKTLHDARSIYEAYHNLLMQDDADVSDLQALGARKLQVLLGVKRFPMRVKCATCAWHAWKDAMHALDGAE